MAGVRLRIAVASGSPGLVKPLSLGTARPVADANAQVIRHHVNSLKERAGQAAPSPWLNGSLTAPELISWVRSDSSLSAGEEAESLMLKMRCLSTWYEVLRLHAQLP